MTNSLKNILLTSSDQYSVFEPNQVLDSHQLNSLVAYLSYQEHLTRVKLLGVGIVGGLHVRLTRSSVSGDTATIDTVTVSRGVGVTTDGDVLTIPTNAVFTKFMPYGPASPRYEPFYVDKDTMRSVFELVRDDTVDASAEPLASLPADLGEMVVVLYMERYENDPDSCSGTDCDNLGKTVFDTPRVLLIARGDTADLLKFPETISQGAQKLPPLQASRPAISKSIETTAELAEIYRESCQSIFESLMKIVDHLNTVVPSLTSNFAAADWTKKLEAHHSQFRKTDSGIQYYYDFLKDLVDNWNEIREVLLSDDSLLCPEVDTFPRHLVLGLLSSPAELRTGLIPSPLIGSQNEKQSHARFLIRKLFALVDGFSLPPPKQDVKSIIGITPSCTEAVSLEERAIPYYYSTAVQLHWNHRLSSRREETRIYRYQTSGTKVFGQQIGRYDFFRVEGHLGHDVSVAIAEIDKAIALHNLPFTVRAVLLHNDPKKIVVRPPIRYGDLHRFHHILRKDLSLQLADTDDFNGKFKTQIDDAVKIESIPSQFGDFAKQSAVVNLAAAQAKPTLAKQSFSDYQQAQQTQDWRASFRTVVNAANRFKGTLSDVTRTNFSTAFDSLLTNNHPAWLEWLESLIKDKDKQEDNKLLFHKFCEQHPGLEHFGGVTRGGTLVLVYDEQARVVTDFMLPYNWADTAEDEPSEPEELPNPVYKDPDLFTNSIKIQPLLDTRFDVFESKLKGTLFKDQLDIQASQLDFLKQSVHVLGSKSVVSGGLTPQRREASNLMLKSLLDEVESKQRLVEDLRGLTIDPSTSTEIRERAQSELGRVELELAESISRSSVFVEKFNIGMEPGGDGGLAIAILSEGMDKVSGQRALETLKNAGAGVRSEHLKRVFKLKGF